MRIFKYLNFRSFKEATVDDEIGTALDLEPKRAAFATEINWW